MLFRSPVVTPSSFITWFQAQQACANAGKRLLTNAEWQMAAAGTPDPGTDDETTDCNVSGPPFAKTPTGSRSKCKSNYEVFDMVGNVWEWVADWIQDKSDVDVVLISSVLYGKDVIAGIDENGPDGFPVALTRGGGLGDGVSTDAGVFALRTTPPSGSGGGIGFGDVTFGFRCAR